MDILHLAFYYAFKQNAQPAYEFLLYNSVDDLDAIESIGWISLLNIVKIPCGLENIMNRLYNRESVQNL
jgi:hypothetical protein